MRLCIDDLFADFVQTMGCDVEDIDYEDATFVDCVEEFFYDSGLNLSDSDIQYYTNKLSLMFEELSG